VDTHVRRLREKLGKAGDAIEPVRSLVIGCGKTGPNIIPPALRKSDK
jgi:hypothetical protein